MSLWTVDYKKSEVEKYAQMVKNGVLAAMVTFHKCPRYIVKIMLICIPHWYGDQLL